MFKKFKYDYYKIENIIWMLFSTLLLVGCIIQLRRPDLTISNAIYFSSFATVEVIIFIFNLKKLLCKHNAYVICCNDGIIQVVLDDKKYAEFSMDELRSENYEKLCKSNVFHSFEEYKKIMMWRVEEHKYE